MNFEFIKIDNDTTKLKIKDKEFTIKKDIKAMSELQKINFKAERKLKFDLKKENLSKSDFIKEYKENGKTYSDNSEYLEMVNDYINELSTDIISELCQEKTGLSLVELLMLADIQDDQEEIEKFGNNLIVALFGVSLDNKKKVTEQSLI